MPRDLILGTAGHIDHGKTALIRALTGTDCDRLPEEKARGITIDIGFARLDLGEYRLGVVDVPGHERFVKNMLAGATGIDVALLIVAADDSIMPQTREHLAILTLLGVREGVIAITKVELVDETTREVVALEVRELVRGTFLENSAIVPTSAIDGTGIDTLKAALRDTAQRVPAASDDEPFRLAIDRVFTVAGHGTVVTGSVTSGSVRVGDTLEWFREDGTRETVRIRGLNNHDSAVEGVRRGQRAAINFAGVPQEQVRRGQVLASPGYLVPSRILTLHLTACTDARPIKHRLPVRAHIGTAEVMGTIALLDRDAIEPGESAFAQIFLREPVTAIWGQPVILRDSAAESTLGGGPVLQPNAGKLRRREAKALERLAELMDADASIRIAAAAWFRGYDGVESESLERTTGVSQSEVSDFLPPFPKGGRGSELRSPSRGGKEYSEFQTPPLRKGGRKTETLLQRLVALGTLVPLPRLFHIDRVVELETIIRNLLANLHAVHPLMTSHDRRQTLAKLDYLDEALLQAVVDRLLKAKHLVGDVRRIARADFQPKLTANQRKLKDKIVEAHRTAGLTPPEPASFANLAAGNAVALRDIYEVAVAEGLLVKISDEMYLSPEVEMQMRATVIARLTVSPATVAEIRDALGTTRKYAVPICEYLDAAGMTVREGDARRLK